MKAQQSAISRYRNVALCYVRESLADAGRQDDLERQRTAILAICDKHGWIPEWYQDTDLQASSPKGDISPQWLVLQARLIDYDVAALVADDLHSLGRNTIHILSVAETCRLKDVAFVLATPQVNLSSRTHEIDVDALTLAELRAKTRSDRIRMGIRYKRLKNNE